MCSVPAAAVRCWIVFSKGTARSRDESTNFISDWPYCDFENNQHACMHVAIRPSKVQTIPTSSTSKYHFVIHYGVGRAEIRTILLFLRG